MVAIIFMTGLTTTLPSSTQGLCPYLCDHNEYGEQGQWDERPIPSSTTPNMPMEVTMAEPKGSLGIPWLERSLFILLLSTFYKKTVDIKRGIIYSIITPSANSTPKQLGDLSNGLQAIKQPVCADS